MQSFNLAYMPQIKSAQKFVNVLQSLQIFEQLYILHKPGILFQVYEIIFLELNNI